MAELNLKINTQQAAQAAQAFQRILQDIKTAARAVDDLAFTKLADTFNRMIAGARNFLSTVENIVEALQIMDVRLRNMYTADYGGRMAVGFRNLRDVIRETRADLSRLNSDLQTVQRTAEAAPRAARASRAASRRTGGIGEDTSTALVTQQDNSFLRMAQDRARMMSQVSAVEAAARQTEMQAQVAMATQLRAFQQARVAAVQETARVEELAAQNSMQVRVNAELAAQAAFQQTQAIRTQQILEVGAVEEAARQREIQAQAAMFAELRQFQQARVQQVIAGARVEEEAAQRSMVARIAAERRVYEVREAFAAMSARSMRALIPQQAGPNAFGESAFNATDFQRRATQAAEAFQRLNRRQPLLLTQQAGPNAFGEGAFAGVTPDATRRVFGGFEEVNNVLGRSSKALIDTKGKKDELDKTLKENSNKTLPGFGSALTSVIAILGYFTVRSIMREIIDLGKTLFEVGRQFENTFALFRAGARDNVEEASRRMLVASDVAKKLGLDLQQTREDFSRLSAAALGSSLEGEKIEKVFYGVASAQAVLGQNTEKGTGIIKVFTDILGKGRLQSEELVKQLGNIVPGSIRVVAEALSKTPQALAQAIAQGTLSVEEVLTKLAAEFEKRYGTEAVKNINRLGGAFNVLKTAIKEVQQVALNSGFAQGLISGFKTLTDFLNEKETRIAVAQLAAFITNILGQAFLYLISILKFVRDNLEQVIKLFVFFTSAAFITGIIAVGRAFAFIGTVLTNMSAIGRLLVFASLIGSMILGKQAADSFSEGLENAQNKFEEWAKELERLRDLQAQDNNNLPDKTRAQIEAQERLDKELRTFNEDLRTQAETFDLVASGANTASISFEAFGRTMERIRALERSDIFGRLDTGDKEKARQNVVDQFFGPEMQALALQEAAKFKQVIDKAKQTRDEALTDFLTLQAVGDNVPMLNAQRDFERQLAPLREKMQEILFTAEPSRIDTISAAFQLWATRLQNLVRETENARTRFKMWIDDLNGLRDLRIDELITKITLGMSNAGSTNTATSIATLEKSLGFLTVGSGGDIDSSLRRFREETERTAESAKKLAEEYKKVNTEVQNVGKVTGGNYDDIINRAGAKFGVSSQLIKSMIGVESNGDPNALSGKGAGGLMQLMPKTAKGLGVTDVNDPEQNIFGGTEYIKQQLDAFHGNLRLALAAYNAGPGAVLEHGGVPPFKETQEYITKVMGKMGVPVIAGAQGNTASFLEKNRSAMLVGTTTEQIKGGPFITGTAEAAIKKTNDAVVDLRIDIEKVSQSEEKAGTQSVQNFNDMEKRAQELARLRRELSIEDAIGLGAANASLKPDVVSQDAMLNSLSKERFIRERLIESIRAGAQAAKDYGLTQEDVADKSEKYLAVLERQRVASELYTNDRLRQGHMSVLAIQEETTALKDQLDVLSLEQRERGIALQKRQQERELSKLVMTPEDRSNAEKQIQLQSELTKRIQDANGPLQQYSDSLTSFYSNSSRLEAFQHSAVNLFKSLEDQIVDFAKTGKFNFKAFADSFIESLLRMELEALIIKPIIDTLKNSLNSTDSSGKGWFGYVLDFVKLGAKAYTGTSTGSGVSPTTFDVGAEFGATGGVVTVSGIRHFQNGGFAGMGTDTIPAMLTPGEIILNKAQQKEVAASMQGKNISVTNNINIQTPNAESFRQSQRQLIDEMSRVSFASMRRAGFDNKNNLSR